MNDLLDLIKRNDSGFEAAFSTAIADPIRAAHALDALAQLVRQNRTEQAELLAWDWLAKARETASPIEALELCRRLLLACSGSAQLRTDLVELYKSAHPDRADLADWLTATGLDGAKVSPARALRAMDMAFAAQPGMMLIDRASQHHADIHQHRLAELVRLDSPAGTAIIRALPPRGGEQSIEILRLADDYVPADPDDFRVLAKTNPDRLRELLADDPGAMMISIIRAAGGQIDTDQLKDTLADDRVLSNAEYSKWWSRARTAAKKSPHVRIEGRNPTMLVYDAAGTTIEEETAATLAKTWEPPARLAVVEGYLKAKAGERQSPDPAFMTALAGRVAKWLSLPGTSLADALVAHQLARLGLPVAEPDAQLARRMLTEARDVIERVIALPESFWPMVIELLPQLRPVGADGDWQSLFLQLLPHAPLASADAIAAALLDAGQSDRLNAEIIAIAESPLESMNGLAWLWVGPARADALQLPRPKELLDQLLWLAKQAETVATTDMKFAREIRATVRGALSARGYTRFREYVAALDPELAPVLRRQVKRADGIGLTVPETMLALLDEQYPPAVEARPTAEMWKRDDIIFVSAEALAGKEKELDHITNVLMPANSRAIAAAAAHGDLSENADYKCAMEERDLLKARAARVQNELAQARLITVDEVATDHVSIYSRVQLVPAAGGEPTVVCIVSPWDSNVADRKFNYKAPFSQLLLGKQVGQVVRLAFDGGPEADYRIQTIRVPE